MTESKVLDSAVIKDLSNHIYEKRKATAFQIEGLTKTALARNDSGTIFQIIGELTQLAKEGSSSSKMGAMTALGSVSVALGSLAIPYFLEKIVRPIFATFRDTDARVRYYACESLYNIAKVARGEILLYFNEVFDILCILVTDTESSVKNAADILDRLIKDIVSAKSSSYVSMLHQQNEEGHEIQSHVITPDGVSHQVNNAQDPAKAFSLPRFIPTLLERMYTIEPFAKKFLLSWLELFDDIPSSELITFLPNFLNPLIRFLMNKCPSDVRIETQNLLNIFLKEIKSIYKVKFEVRKKQILREREKKRRVDELSTKRRNSSDAEVKVDTPLPSSTEEQVNDRFENDSTSVKSSSTTIIRKVDPPLESSENNVDASDFDVTTEFINGQDIYIDYPKIIEILISFLKPETFNGSGRNFRANDFAGESHEVYLEIQTIALKWLREIISISPISFSKFLPNCVSIIIQNVAFTDDHNDVNLRNHFLEFDNSLKSLLIRMNESQSELQAAGDVNLMSDDQFESICESMIQGLNKELYDEFLEMHLMPTIDVVMRECLSSINELARLTSLDWLVFLYSNYKSSFFANEEENEKTSRNHFDLDLSALLRSSVDASNEVISKVLTLAAQISDDSQEFFREFMVKLMTFFESDGESGNNIDSEGVSGTITNQIALPRKKIEFIIRKLCVSISSERIFKSLSEVLLSFEDTNIAFIGDIVVTFNNILLTTHELQDLRKKLKNIDICKGDDWVLFSTLFKSWCHNIPSVLSLCLLTSNYELAYLIIKSLADSEVTFQLLTQLDVLVQLLESQIFLKLRLQLLEPEKNPYLYKTLYGILMIMPQSSTYTTLKNRLTSLTVFTSNNPSVTLHGSSTPVTTPSASGPAGTTNTQQLSIRKKRILELADKFVKTNELHENAKQEPKINRPSDAPTNSTRASSGTNFPGSDTKSFMADYFYQTSSEKPLPKSKT